MSRHCKESDKGGRQMRRSRVCDWSQSPRFLTRGLAGRVVPEPLPCSGNGTEDFLSVDLPTKKKANAK